MSAGPPGTGEIWRDSTSSSLSLSLSKRCLGTQEINSLGIDGFSVECNHKILFSTVVVLAGLFTEYLDLISALECSEKNQI